jgi:small subunit ribosomal protein S8
MITDPIADMLTRIRNATVRGSKEVMVPTTKMLEAISVILEKEGFVHGHKVEQKQGEPQGTLIISLKYVNGESAITHAERVSKPGLRNYIGYHKIPVVRRGIGMVILSTSKGVMTGNQAKTEKIGGELLLKIW